MSKKVLIVEDEYEIAHDLQRIIEKLHYEVIGPALSASKATQLLNENPPDIVLLTLQPNEAATGIYMARMLNEHYHIPFILVTSFSDKETISLIKETNPYGYIRHPYREQDVYAALEIALSRAEGQQWVDQRRYFNEETERVYGFENILGESEPIQHLFNLIDRVAPANTTVLLQGETGTGKELVAQAIHDRSPRQAQPMVKINCAALPSELIESELFGHEKGTFTGAVQARTGKLELAHQSTVFLDEIGELPLALQAKLLRFLQEKEVEPLGSNRTRKVDVRVVAATNRRLQEEVATGRFRSDLYFRLNVFPLIIPPLRERGSDIIMLAQHFVKRASKRLARPAFTLSATVARQLNHYTWPGNVRELEHVIERAVLLSEGPTLTIPPFQSIPKPSDSQLFTPTRLQDLERDHIYLTLQFCGGRIRGDGGAAKLLGVKPTTLEAKIKKLGLRKEFTK